MIDVSKVPVVPCACLSCVCFWLIFAIVAIPLSFEGLAQGKYALLVNWRTQKIDRLVDEAGMHHVGFGNYLAKFPSTFQLMFFLADRRLIDTIDLEPDEKIKSVITRGPIRTRSNDGLEMYVSLSLQFRFDAESLHPLYTLLGNHLYHDEFVRFVRKSIVHTVSLYSATAFFKHRAAITEEMFRRMRDEFVFESRKHGRITIIIEGLQLREVDLPDAFDKEMADTQTEMQEVEVSLARRAEQEKVAERNVSVTRLDAQRRLTEAEGSAAKVRIENAAIVELMLLYQELQATASAEVLGAYKNDSQPFRRLLETMQLRSISVHGGSQMALKV
eukprot:TRINITY_DN69701_c0_g1_i1.p1 TRINITY_DN69701_c0_g1~~TRINITY_DN69701_c0_g1_i1.p1  ORF type:complete len:331 (-),score=55.99 TRINITY_DN69701_c0_g1_i1:150-1142(-)